METTEESDASFLSTGEAITSKEIVEEGRNQPKTVLPKKLKIIETLEEEAEDQISALPDCLIIQILSLLPSTKDAIRTDTLSKRWKSLWTLTPALIFQQKLVTYCRIDRLTSDFISFVNRTLIQCCHSKLNKFEVNIRYDIQFVSQINDWIRYAISRNVEELDLKLCHFNHGDRCVLDEQFFINSCFTDLRLNGFIFNPNGAISWRMLRNLCISNAYLKEDLIENILSGSPVLETLELDRCYGYKRLDITSKSVKNFVLCGYVNPNQDDDHADVIEINTPNILSLKIQGDLLLWKLLLVDVSSLVEVELDYTKLGYYRTFRKDAKEEMLKGFIQSLHGVKELTIGNHCAMVFYRLQAKGLSSPTNVKVSRMW